MSHLLLASVAAPNCVGLTVDLTASGQQ